MLDSPSVGFSICESLPTLDPDILLSDLAELSDLSLEVWQGAWDYMVQQRVIHQDVSGAWILGPAVQFVFQDGTWDWVELGQGELFNV